MLVSPSRMSRKRFCSRRCLGAENAERVNRIRKPAKNNPAWFKPEDVRGRANPKWVESLELSCKQCGNTFYRKPWYTRISGYKGDFCSTGCRDLYKAANLSGENSPSWVGGITTYRGKGWDAARMIAVTRDSGACQRCGKVVGISIPVHHIKPFREFETVEEANHPSNLQCLCQSCHMAVENQKMAA